MSTCHAGSPLKVRYGLRRAKHLALATVIKSTGDSSLVVRHDESYAETPLPRNSQGEMLHWRLAATHFERQTRSA
ncbi:MAG: hypothetical protein EHM79_20525 [Geobacter sp.]|nr:MAG: hypothetical protein EHM79_20525 [Geobacter sp.]